MDAKLALCILWHLPARGCPAFPSFFALSSLIARLMLSFFFFLAVYE